MIIGCHFTKTRIFSTYLENFICYFVGLKNADCNSLEKVQEKFVKNVRGLRTTDYRDRLRELGILTLVDRRQYLDLVEVFKIIKGFNNVCHSDYFTLQGDVDRPTTRGSVFPLNIVHPRSNLEIRRHFFGVIFRSIFCQAGEYILQNINKKGEYFYSGNWNNSI